MQFNLSGINEEASLVKRCKNNDSTAQHALYNAYVEDMMILCLRYIPRQEDAKEVLMDAFLSFFRNIGTFTYRGQGSVKAWLKQIVVNQCLMHLRKRSMPLVSIDNSPLFEDQEAAEDIFGNLVAKEILKLLHELPDIYRTIFNLYVFEDMGHKEIAELLGISENTSKSQLHRARTLLKKQILLSEGTSLQTENNEKAK